MEITKEYEFITVRRCPYVGGQVIAMVFFKPQEMITQPQCIKNPLQHLKISGDAALQKKAEEKKRLEEETKLVFKSALLAGKDDLVGKPFPVANWVIVVVDNIDGIQLVDDQLEAPGVRLELVKTNHSPAVLSFIKTNRPEILQAIEVVIPEQQPDYRRLYSKFFELVAMNED